MAKFYVSSGLLERVISRKSPQEAARDAMLDDILNGGRIDSYGRVTEVSETGFAHKKEEGVFFSTQTLLTEIGVL